MLNLTMKMLAMIKMRMALKDLKLMMMQVLMMEEMEEGVHEVVEGHAQVKMVHLVTILVRLLKQRPTASQPSSDSIESSNWTLLKKLLLQSCL